MSDEVDEVASICLIIDTTFEDSELDQEDEVNFDNPKPESLRKPYHELLYLAHLFFQKITKA